MNIESQKLLSVIVPVHNGEKFLNRCVDSILASTYQNLEILLIENASVDNSFECCLTRENEKVHCIQVSEPGVSNARNVGLKFARGEYVAFVDVDDYISPDMYELMINCAEENGSDIVFCDFIQGQHEAYLFSDIGEAKSIPVSHNEFYAHCFLTANLAYTVVWNKVFQSSFLLENSLFFNTNLSYAEDREYVVRCVAASNQINYILAPLYYYYRGNNNSICNDSTNLICRMDQVYSLQDNLNLFSKEMFSYECIVACLLQTADFRLKRAKEIGLREQEHELKCIIKKVLPLVWQAKKLPKVIKFKFLTEHYFPRLFYRIYKLKQKVRR